MVSFMSIRSPVYIEIKLNLRSPSEQSTSTTNATFNQNKYSFQIFYFNNIIVTWMRIEFFGRPHLVNIYHFNGMIQSYNK